MFDKSVDYFALIHKAKQILQDKHLSYQTSLKKIFNVNEGNLIWFWIFFPLLATLWTFEYQQILI